MKLTLNINHLEHTLIKQALQLAQEQCKANKRIVTHEQLANLLRKCDMNIEQDRPTPAEVMNLLHSRDGAIKHNDFITKVLIENKLDKFNINY